MFFIYTLGEWLLVLALIGLIGVLVFTVMTALQLKNGAMGSYKRLSERPIRAVQNLAAAGKGVAQREGVRVKQIGATVKGAADVVKDTAGDVKTAVESVHPSDLKPALANAQNVLKILSLAAKFTRASVRQGPTR